jgi:two-component sensor histidine kinase
MAQVHELLYQSDQLAFVLASDYIALLYQELASSYHEVSRFVNPHLDIDPLQLPLDTAIPLGLIVNELVSNALKYAYILNPTGQLRIILKEEGSRRVLRIEDDGVGLPEGWEKNLPNTLGLTLVQSLAQQLQGTLAIRVDSGTKVRLEF